MCWCRPEIRTPNCGKPGCHPGARPGSLVATVFPRRNDINQMTAAELAILKAQYAVEAMPADPLLTDAVVLLDQARAKVADFVDREH